MRRGWRVVMAVAGALVLAAAGCTGPPALATAGLSAAQAQTAVWVRGDVQAADRAPLKDVFAAAHWALVDLDFRVEQETLYEHIGFIRARAGGKSVKVVMERLSSVATRYSIRVGTFGDEIVSRLILNRVQEMLQRKDLPPVEAPPPPANLQPGSR